MYPPIHSKMLNSSGFSLIYFRLTRRIALLDRNFSVLSIRFYFHILLHLLTARLKIFDSLLTSLINEYHPYIYRQLSAAFWCIARDRKIRFHDNK